MEQYVGKRMIDAVIVGPKADISSSTGSSFRRRWRPAMFPIVMTPFVARSAGKSDSGLG
jgi:hypothetical protein